MKNFSNFTDYSKKAGLPTWKSRLAVTKIRHFPAESK